VEAQSVAVRFATAPLLSGDVTRAAVRQAMTAAGIVHIAARH